MRRPLGPVAVVTPWNWPYTMPAEIVAPALAAGNTVVWTPAPSTAVCSGLLAECVAEADLPPGRLQLRARARAGRRRRDRLEPGHRRRSASSARPRPGGGSPSAPPARRCCSRWAATGRWWCSTAPTSTPRSRRAISACFLCAGPELHGGRAAAGRTSACGTSSSSGWPRGSASEVRLGDPFARRDDDGAAQQRAGRGEDGRARRRTRSSAARRVVAGGAREARLPDRPLLAGDDPRRRARRRRGGDRGDVRPDRADRRDRRRWSRRSSSPTPRPTACWRRSSPAT